MENQDVEEIKRILGLKKHPREGGYFRETYRAISTAIYYFISAGSHSEMHRITADEIYHFYLGDPVENLQLFPNGKGKTIIFGNNLNAGEVPQFVVPGGVWQGSRLLPRGRFALMGTTVAPGFEYRDYESGQRDDLIKNYPQFKEIIRSLT